MTELYTSGRYLDENPDWHDRGGVLKAEVLANLALAHALRPEKVVDVGCGGGLALRSFKDMVELRGWSGVDFEGWDIASAAIDRARRHTTAGLRFHVGDWLASGETADLVLCVDVFEHVADDRTFLRRLAGQTEFALFRIPLDDCRWNRARPERLRELERRYGHLHHYHRKAALERLTAAGFEPLGGVYHRVPPDLMRLRSVAMDALRRRLFARWPHLTVRTLGGWSLVVLAQSTVKA
ncbi:MAG: class I SAM-dependent methyltransferase [Proteobacteria bacterium]|nr:class I SAM-dependent methyltransferase [Pseudomonadota bacterium]